MNEIDEDSPASGLSSLLRQPEAPYKPFGRQLLPDTFPTNPAPGDEPQDMFGRSLGGSLGRKEQPESFDQRFLGLDQGRGGFDFPETNVPEDAAGNLYFNDWELQRAYDVWYRMQETPAPDVFFTDADSTPQPTSPDEAFRYLRDFGYGVTEQDLWNLFAATDDPVPQRQIGDAINILRGGSNPSNFEPTSGSEDTAGLFPYEPDSVRDSDPRLRIRRTDSIGEYSKDKFGKDNFDKGDK